MRFSGLNLDYNEVFRIDSRQKDSNEVFMVDSEEQKEYMRFSGLSQKTAAQLWKV